MYVTKKLDNVLKVLTARFSTGGYLRHVKMEWPTDTNENTVFVQTRIDEVTDTITLGGVLFFSTSDGISNRLHYKCKPYIFDLLSLIATKPYPEQADIVKGLACLVYNFKGTVEPTVSLLPEVITERDYTLAYKAMDVLFEIPNECAKPEKINNLKWWLKNYLRK